MANTDHAGLPPQALRPTCDPATLGFGSTRELDGDDQLIGQDRAMDAIRLAAGIRHADFNLFVQGNSGMGRRRAVMELLREQAEQRPAPCDWVYVNNFEAPHKPRALKLAPGRALELKSAMEELVDDLAIEIPAMFESEDYQAQRRALEQEYGQRQETAMAEFAERAKSESVAVMRTPMGYMLAPIRNGEVVKPDVYEKLPQAEREEIDARIARLQEELAKILQQAPKIERELRRRLEDLHRGMAERVVRDQVQDVADLFPDHEGVQAYLEEVRQDMIVNAALFLELAAQAGQNPFPEAVRKAHPLPVFQRYAVNVMVSHPAGGTGAPLESEDLPTLDRLTGRIEHLSEMGALVTNFTLIKPGALHRANGGYLVIDARRLLSEPMAWPALKQCLQSGSIPITSMAERLSLMSTVSLQPDPIPLDVRVVLIGDRLLYALLSMLDPDFHDLFKLQADFEDDMDQSDEARQLYARMIAARAKRDGIRPLTAAGVARVLDEATRAAGDNRKFSLRLDMLSDLMREADFYAAKAGRDEIDVEEINRTVAERERRASRLRDRLQEAVQRGTILIDTEGARVGQVNGLAVSMLGGFAFGHPSRITARVRMGSGEFIDIEREVELGGPLHSKGVLILAGYLTSTYALDVPFSLRASLVFEQTYSGVDGDSASSTELYALLSALSELPIDQGLAVTGSVNQEGEVQAIGGVNEKIEGFFETCRRRGLTGRQGVLIPKSNVQHLMLKPEVVEAVAQGKFRVIPVETIDEGIALLTGREAGVRGPDGNFPPDSVNGLVEARLRAFAEARRAFGKTDGNGEESK